MYGLISPCFKECYLLGAQIVLYLFMTIWQLNEGVLLKCTVYRAEVSATFHKFSVPGLMPNMAQSKRFRAIDEKKKLFKLSTGTKRITVILAVS